MAFTVPPKLALAHYFTPYTYAGGASQTTPTSASTDAQFAKYINPAGGVTVAPHGVSESSSVVGGMLRDQPIGRGATSAANWGDNDMEAEIRNAITGGIDGFTLDILNTAYTGSGSTGGHWLLQESLMRAAATVGNFFITPMFDMGSWSGQTPAALVARAKTLFGFASAQKLNGKFVLSAFHAEHWANGGSDTAAQAVTNWNTAIASLEAAGFPIAFVPCFLNYDTSKVAFQSITTGKMVGAGSWGNRSPAAQSGEAARSADAHSRGWFWMQAVSVQDERPDQDLYDEAVNTLNLEYSWAAACGYTGGFGGSTVANASAEWVQIPTWNDFSEGTQLAPSKYNGWAYTNLSKYYCGLWKAGLTPATAPTPTVDSLFLTHRLQRHDATISGGSQTDFQVRRGGTSAASDLIEVVSVLTAPGTVKLNVGGTITTFSAPAGFARNTVPLAAGTILATLSRTGQADLTVQTPLAVPTPITASTVQNEQYIAATTSSAPVILVPTTLTADFEKGTNGVAINVGDPGSASAFDANAGAAGGAGTTSIYDNTHAAHGSLAAKFATGSTTIAAASLKWTTSLTPAAAAGPFYARAYLYLTANPTVQPVPISFMFGAFTIRVGVRITTGGHLAVIIDGSAVDATTTSTIPLNQWFRVELDAKSSTTAGSYAMRLYASADSSTPTETLVNSGINTGGTIDSIAFGCTQQVLNQGPFWMDDLAANAVGPIGPVGTILSGPTAALTFSSPSGTVSTPQGFSAPPATLTFSAPAGTIPALSITVAGPTSTLAFSSPAGAIGSSYAALPATLAFSAIAGSLDIPPLIFRTPTIRLSPADPQGESLWMYYAIDVGVTVLKMQDGTYHTTTFPTEDDIAAAAVTYMGGHEYPVSSDEWAALAAAGLTT